MNPEVFTIPQAAAQFPTRPSVATVWRWILNGVKGPEGQLIVLHAQRLGRRRFVTREAIDRFVAAFNESAQQRSEANLHQAREAARALQSIGC